ncbi:glycine zipper 2TM domain-containing protein [Hydrogenophaga sp. R2]|uniref:glycine zipper 2TM domain-containing protein n=1 Tax=Hydrogenophaga sp. R2 TaxID=3132827 RepID=UPI003CFA5D62
MNTRRLSLLALACAALSGHGMAQAQQEEGRVISSTPVIQQVAVPRQVCSDEVVTYEGRSSGAGALLGAVAGGAAGNAIGNGGGRAAATVIGLIGGAMLGDRIEGRGPAQSETVTRCGTQTMYEPRTVAYDVVYEYAGRQYRTQMAQDPGRFVRLNVAPVDALPAAPPPVYPQRPQVIYQTPYPAQTQIYSGTTYYPATSGVVVINGQRYHRPYDPDRRWDNRYNDRHWDRDGRRWDRD